MAQLPDVKFILKHLPGKSMIKNFLCQVYFLWILDMLVQISYGPFHKNNF